MPMRISDNVDGMTSDQYDSIIQVLRSMNERLSRIEQAAEPVEEPNPLITRRLIFVTLSMAALTIVVYLGFNYLLGNLMSFLPDS